MTSHTVTMNCPRCNSGDCNLTSEDLGKLIVAPIRRKTIFCNTCTYTKVSLVVISGEICTETKVPGYEDTEIEYMYLGRERGEDNGSI